MRTIIIISVLVVFAQTLTAQPPSNDHNAQKPEERHLLQIIADILANWFPKPNQPIQQNGTESTEWSNESWNSDSSTENESGSAETSEASHKIDLDEESKTIEESSNELAEDDVEEKGTNITSRSIYSLEPENVRWITWMGQIPADAVYVGDDLDGEPIFVGRASHNGSILPGKAKPTEGNFLFGYNFVEFSKKQFQMLSGKNLKWKSAAYGNVPYNAVLGGRSENGENLYIGRIPVQGVLVPGRVQPSLMTATVSFGGKEHQSSFYDVLVEEK